MIEIKLLSREDFEKIPSVYLQKNFIASSKIAYIDEASWKNRINQYIDSGTTDFYGAFFQNELIGMIGVTWPKIMPAYVIHNLRVFKAIEGFPIEKNGYADLLSHVIKTGESKNLWEIYTKRSLEIKRWGNNRYKEKVIKQIPISVKYQRAIVEIIEEGKYSEWPLHDSIFGKEKSLIKTAVIKYWCPPLDRENSWIPQEFHEDFVKTYF
jgi:hypothetical protein